MTGRQSCAGFYGTPSSGTLHASREQGGRASGSLLESTDSEPNPFTYVPTEQRLPTQKPLSKPAMDLSEA